MPGRRFFAVAAALSAAAVPALSRSGAGPVFASVFARRPASSVSQTAEWPFSDISPPAALTPSFASSSAKNGFSMVSGRAGGGVAATAAALRAAMAASGWTPVPPTQDNAGAAFWTRGEAVALVGVSPSSDGEGCVWIVARLRQKFD